MMKKNEVLEALENGGRIMVDSIYRTARVLDADGNEMDTCRYDTAERIEKSAGYTRRNTDWYATWFIEKDWNAASEAVKEAVTDALRVFEAAGVISDLKIEPLTAAQVEEITARTAAQEEEQPAPDYLRENWPTSNENPAVYYSIEHAVPGSAGAWYKPARTVDDLQSKLSQLQAQGCEIRAAWRHDRETGERRQFIPETRQEQTDRENRDRCRRIAEKLEAYAGGDMYKCPHCGEVHTMDEYEETEHENEYGRTAYTCPNCGEEIEEDDLEAVGIYDFFEDCLDIEYRCDARREYRSVSVMVTCGGPNIYIDTDEKAVLLYWWGDKARYYLSSDAVEAVDAWAEEHWSCL